MDQAIAQQTNADRDEISAEIKAIEKQLSEIRAEIERIKEEEQKIAGREVDLLSEIGQINKRIAANEKLLRTLRQKKMAVAKDLEVSRIDLETSQGAYLEARDRLSSRLRAIYKFGRGDIMEVLLTSTTFSGLARRIYYLSVIAEHDRQLMKEFEERVELQRVLVAHVEEKKQSLEAVEREISEQNQKLRLIRNERDALLASLKEKRAYYEIRSKELIESSRHLEEIISGFEPSRSEFTARQSFASKRGNLVWPCQGEVIGYFGIETHPKFGTIIRNNGIDIKSSMAAQVRAVAEGNVSFAGEVSGLGRCVIIAHGDGFYSLYGRLESIKVREGMDVGEAEVIGTIGETSSPEGAVLHFEIRKGKQALDPLTWLLK